MPRPLLHILFEFQEIEAVLDGRLELQQQRIINPLEALFQFFKPFLRRRAMSPAAFHDDRFDPRRAQPFDDPFRKPQSGRTQHRTARIGYRARQYTARLNHSYVQEFQGAISTASANLPANAL